jgi:hypothetical protein
MKPAANIAAGLSLLMSLCVPLAALAGPGAPPGWIITGAKPGDYEFGTEHVEGSEGQMSAYIKAKSGATADGWGTLAQTIKADKYIGQRLRLSVRLKSDAVSRLQMWFEVDGANHAMIVYNNMDDRPVTGTTDWKRYDIVLDVPPNGSFIDLGFFLQGGEGEGWADAVKLEKVDKTVPITLSTGSGTLGKPTNLNFDQ